MSPADCANKPNTAYDNSWESESNTVHVLHVYTQTLLTNDQLCIQLYQS